MNFINLLSPPNSAPDPISQLGLQQDYSAGAQPWPAAAASRRNQPVGRESSTCTQVVWISFWLIVLVLLAYPIALLAGLLYALCNPLNLIQCCRPFIELLMKLLNLPQSCTRNMAEAKQLIIM